MRLAELHEALTWPAGLDLHVYVGDCSTMSWWLDEQGRWLRWAEVGVGCSLGLGCRVVVPLAEAIEQLSCECCLANQGPSNEDGGDNDGHLPPQLCWSMSPQVLPRLCSQGISFVLDRRVQLGRGAVSLCRTRCKCDCLWWRALPTSGMLHTGLRNRKARQKRLNRLA
jgi:hypothetical protein